MLFGHDLCPCSRQLYESRAKVSLGASFSMCTTTTEQQELPKKCYIPDTRFRVSVDGVSVLEPLKPGLENREDP